MLLCSAAARLRGVDAALAFAFQVAIEAGAADAQQLRRAHAVAAAGFEHLLDMLVAHFLERKRAPGFARGAVAGPAAGCALANRPRR